MPTSNSRFTHKSEQCSAAWLDWPCSWGCGFVMQHVQWQCWFQLFSLSSVPITELTFLGRIFFFFNRISPLIQFKMQYCKQLCCHNQMGWRWAVRREEMESGSQGRYLILSLHWVYICFLFLMRAVFCFLLLQWVKHDLRRWWVQDSRLSPPCSVHLPSQASLLFYPTLLHCFGKVALRLPLSKKGSLRRQDVFSQQIPASFTPVKTGRYGQRDYPFQSESPFQQDFMIVQVSSYFSKNLTAIRWLMQLTAVTKGEELSTTEGTD